MTDGLKYFKTQGGFFGRYVQVVQDTMIPYQYQILNDQIEGAAKSNALANFITAAQINETGRHNGAFYGMVFQDSDVAKWLEAAAYSLAIRRDEKLLADVQATVDLIARAQEPDGYLDTYFTIEAPQRKWTSLQEAHELYCAGHMMEAAVALYESIGCDKLIKVMSRFTNHIYQRFMIDGIPGYPGHPEVELALVRMYHATGESKYLELAAHFINVRGVDSDYFIKERKQFPWTVFNMDPHDKSYLQNQVPLRKMTEATGHAVRMVYLLSGMADIALEYKDADLAGACRRAWDNITGKRMYVTGGIGAAYEGEQFTKDYHLPNDTAYAETCASIGLIFFASRMLRLDKRSEYADVMERALYNCVLAGMQLDGTRFFYVNPLEVLPGISGEAPSHKHALAQRPRWYACACCPPNIARLLGSLGRYTWSIEQDAVYCHLFVAGELDLTEYANGKLQIETAYPNDGLIRFRFLPKEAAMRLTLAVRIPDWSHDTQLQRNGKNAIYELRNGYAYISGDFKSDDMFDLQLDMSVKTIYPNSKIAADSGRVAFMRGPLVYCAEGMDNGGSVVNLRVKHDGQIISWYTDELFGIETLQAQGYSVHTGDALYSSVRPEVTEYSITLIPYYAWGNRGLTEMRVWLPEIR